MDLQILNAERAKMTKQGINSGKHFTIRAVGMDLAPNHKSWLVHNPPNGPDMEPDALMHGMAAELFTSGSTLEFPREIRPHNPQLDASITNVAVFPDGSAKMVKDEAEATALGGVLFRDFLVPVGAESDDVQMFVTRGQAGTWSGAGSPGMCRSGTTAALMHLMKKIAATCKTHDLETIDARGINVCVFNGVCHTNGKLFANQVYDTASVILAPHVVLLVGTEKNGMVIDSTNHCGYDAEAYWSTLQRAQMSATNNLHPLRVLRFTAGEWLQLLAEVKNNPDSLIGKPLVGEYLADAVAAKMANWRKNGLNEGSRVRLFGLQSKPELNGQWVTVGKHVAESDRWEIPAKAILVRATNMLWF